MKLEEEIKQTKFDNPVEKVIVNVIYTYNEIRDMHMVALKPFGLLIQHYNILRILRGKYPEPVCPGEIKEVMLDKGNDVTRLVDKLVSMGYAHRQLCETNRRKMEIFITEKGLQATADISLTFNKLMENFNNHLTNKELDVLNSLLDKFRG